MRTFTLAFRALIAASLCGATSFAQQDAAFQSLLYPRSVASSGLGEQGVAARNAADAMHYNPANLAFVNGTGVSFFRNPWNILRHPYPLTSISAAGKLSNGGSAGLEYTDWDLGDFVTTNSASPEPSGRFHSYQRSLAGGYAMPLSDQFAVGAQLRYVWQPISPSTTLQHLLFSAGVSYRPEELSDRLNLGLSLMNFSTPIHFGGTVGTEMESNEDAPPPSEINIGLEASAVTNKFYDVAVSLGATKPLSKRGGPPDYAAQSSFTSLFNDWTDFPNDMTAQIGLGYLWHPLYLGGGVSFFQDMYVGYFSVGPKDLPESFYTHGFNVGLTARGISATVGYAGQWHNNRASSYLPWIFPWETFQFGLSTDMTVFGERENEKVPEDLLDGVILSGGYSYGLVVGKMKEANVNGMAVSFSNNSFWSVEADFYMNDVSAILTSITYSRMTENVRWLSFPSSGLPLETFSLESGFRYHPIETFQPFFVQGSLGVIRMNPVPTTSPRYFYNTFDRLAVGCAIPIGSSGVIVIPRVGLTTIFMNEYSNGSRLGGYNQFEFGVNAGYRL